MRYLPYSFLLLLACASDYKGLRSVAVDEVCAKKVRPGSLQTSWYDASVDVTGKHISGLLLIKKMPDSSDRVVFTNEAGIKFLDFEWKKNDAFTAHHVIRQLNKKAVIGLLRQDFELMLGKPFKNPAVEAWENKGEIFYGVTQKKETHYFITARECASLLRIESGSDKKRKVSMWLYGDNRHKPDSIRLKHHTFVMEISLIKLARE
jgi:hypothetical protein